MEMWEIIITAVLGIIILVAVLIKIYSRLTVGMCDSDQDMTGKTILITGATAGIGRETAKELGRRNARIILACRNVEKAQKLAEEISSSTGNKNVVVRQLDLTSFVSVRKCAEEVLNTEDKLHILINNAGIFGSDKRMTEDGCETILQANHLGHFLLTMLLLDLLKKSAPSRIINVSSEGYKYGKLDVNDMDGKHCKLEFDLYTRSKLANILFTRELASRLTGSGVTVNALHPGAVSTDLAANTRSFIGLLSRWILWSYGKTAEEGAQTTIHLAVYPKLEKTTGKYFSDCKEQQLVRKALNETLAKALFEASEEIVGICHKKN